MQRALPRHAFRRALLGAGVLLAVGASTAAADDGFVQTNLVSDIPGIALATDANLVNPWGLSAGPTTPVWTSNNGTGTSNLFLGFTKAAPAISINPLLVTIPPAPGLPTGTVFNSSTNPEDFKVTDGTTTAPARFLFASLLGTITGWSPTVGTGGNPPPSTTAEVAATVPGAVYTGLAMAVTNAGARLYAANFAQGRVDVWDGAWVPAAAPGAFTDDQLPEGYSPFNVQVIGNKLYVAYAMVDPASGRSLSKAGAGAVDVYTLQGRLAQRLITHTQLNAPWGLVRAPGNFGSFSKALLVGNFGNGRIHAYDIRTGELLGTLSDPSGHAIVNDGLWGLRIGNNTLGTKHTLILAAGIQGETHGLLAAIQPAG
jgi:uncharacterized protein (TIGR03118 family)